MRACSKRSSFIQSNSPQTSVSVCGQSVSMRDYYINSQQTFHYITSKVIAPFYNRYKASLLTDFYCLGSAELTLDETVLKFPAEVGHAEFRRVERDVGVAFVETGLNPDLKVFMQIIFRY